MFYTYACVCTYVGVCVYTYLGLLVVYSLSLLIQASDKLNQAKHHMMWMEDKSRQASGYEGGSKLIAVWTCGVWTCEMWTCGMWTCGVWTCGVWTWWVWTCGVWTCGVWTLCLILQTHGHIAAEKVQMEQALHEVQERVHIMRWVWSHNEVGVVP